MFIQPKLGTRVKYSDQSAMYRLASKIHNHQMEQIHAPSYFTEF